MNSQRENKATDAVKKTECLGIRVVIEPTTRGNHLTDLFQFLEENSDDGSDLVHINDLMRQRYGWLDCFETLGQVKDLVKLPQKSNSRVKNSPMFGDYQTPTTLVDQIGKHAKSLGLNPQIMIEPTVGTGNFIIPFLKIFPNIRFVYCVEIQPEYRSEFTFNLINYLELTPEKKIVIEFHNDSIFDHPFSRNLMAQLSHNNNQILIVGNPPWVTNSAMGKLKTSNLPSKSNFQIAQGLEAITGSSNFDIAESIIWSLLQKFMNYETNLLMICKRSVCLKIYQRLEDSNIMFRAKQINFDSHKEFQINAAASILMVQINNVKSHNLEVYDLGSSDIVNEIGFVRNNLVFDMEKYKKLEFLEGNSNIEWRQGIKHDATRVMTFKLENGEFVNQLGSTIKKSRYLFPLLKGSKIRKEFITETTDYVLVTQSKLGEDTKKIRKKDPTVWRYLLKHEEYLSRRKSRIYQGNPKFAIFGIGDYSFKPYKIAIASMYKEPLFSLISHEGLQPVMVDDTCYTISFNSFEEALIHWVLLNLQQSKDFLKSISLSDAKRRYTKKVLMRLDVTKYLIEYDFEELQDRIWTKVLRNGINHKLSKNKFNSKMNDLQKYAGGGI